MTLIDSTHCRGETPSLLKLLIHQRDLYRQLKMLSDQQAALIAAGDTDQLLAILGQRQRMVDALTTTNRDLAAYRKASPDLQAGLLPGQREEVRTLMDEVDALLHGIIEQDDRDRQQLQSAQQAVGAQIKQVARGGAAVNAYRSNPGGFASRFTDRRG